MFKSVVSSLTEMVSFFFFPLNSVVWRIVQPQAGSGVCLLPDVSRHWVRDGVWVQLLPLRGNQSVHPGGRPRRVSGTVHCYRDESSTPKPAHTGYRGSMTDLDLQ